MKREFYKYITDKEDKEIEYLLHQVMDKKAPTIAAAIGCDYQDMINRVNANQPRSPRKFELVLRILDEVRNPEPFIRWFNERYGYLPPIRVPETTLCKDPLYMQMTKVAKEMGDVSRELIEANQDDFIDMEELARIKKEIMDLIQSALELNLAIIHDTNFGD